MKYYTGDIAATKIYYYYMIRYNRSSYYIYPQPPREFAPPYDRTSWEVDNNINTKASLLTDIFREVGHENNQ